MADILITMWYNYIANILMEAKLVKTIPKLEIVSVKRYRGQIVKEGKIFIKIQINRLNFDVEDNTDIIHIICHEFAHMKHWQHGEEHNTLTIDYRNRVYKQLMKDNNITPTNDIQKSNEKEITKMYEQITIKELVKVLENVVKEMLDIDIELTNDTNIHNLEPIGLIYDNKVLKCRCGTEIYLNNVNTIRIFGTDNKIKNHYQIEKILSSSKITKKDLEIILLQNLLNNKDERIIKLELKKLDDVANLHSVLNDRDTEIEELKKTIEKLENAIKEIDKINNKTKTGRKPYNNTKVIEIIRNLRLEGNGYLEIANRLNSMNLLTDKNKLWGASSIKCIIKRYIEK